MAAISLDQVLRTLDPGGEVRLSLSSVPIDELLLTLHETRFTGILVIGAQPDEEHVIFRDGRVLDVVPPRDIHVQHLTSILDEMRAVSEEVARALLEEDPGTSGDLFARRLAARGHVRRDVLKRVLFEQARRRLFYLYEHAGEQALLRQGLTERAPNDALPVDPLPAIAYGIVARAHPTRRQAMLAFAARKRARLIAEYDRVRNRCGLPPACLDAVGHLAGDGVRFEGVPCLPGLTPDVTAGVLLLFQRMGLLAFGEVTLPPLHPEDVQRKAETMRLGAISTR